LALSTAKGFSALDLMIVFAVTAVCVTMGGPLLSDYSVRTRVIDALVVAEGAKTAVTLTCAEDPMITLLNKTLAGYRPQRSDHVQTVHLAGSCIHPTIMVVTENTGAEVDPTLVFSGDFSSGSGGNAWTCVSNGLNAHLPETCRK
jgi:type IV pilus assembly protein PilA